MFGSWTKFVKNSFTKVAQYYFYLKLKASINNPCFCVTRLGAHRILIRQVIGLIDPDLDP